MGSRDITAAEAVEYAKDPRNDNGESNAIHVMAFSYDSDCPNDEDHVGAIIARGDTWFDGDSFVAEEAEAKLYATAEEARLVVSGLNMAPSYSGSFVIVDPCRCYDGIYPDDVQSCMTNGVVDIEDFAAWGPFQLWWEGEHDPGPPRAWSAGEGLAAIASRLEACEAQVGNDGMSLRMQLAVDAIHKLVTSIEDGTSDEFGEPGECWERIVNDDGILEQFAEEHDGKQPDLNDDATRDAVAEWAKAKGLGRHMVGHCIWCLEAP